MKTIFNYKTKAFLINRIRLLNENSKPQWGQMNAHQMLLHCIKYEKMMQGRVRYKRVLVGYLFGNSALKEDFLKDDSPIKKNTPTLRQLKVKNVKGDFETNKMEWISLIEDYHNIHLIQIVHPFFGKLSSEQVGFLVFKHIDHHLRQFNC
ncbi:DinB family protein [Membranicola marinus]|uniref:DinB family protein n=1 Tax=Membranihabitans marinus TaxID=1227546 RepID=A0A953HV32_9BACT|nr:DUF1569 domain-containing protein [Membranihabitans marinus]MBY5957061.1 DinB family protein [Membranihabitans marinus]